MTKEEMIEALAALLAGLQAPLSIGLPLGAAKEPYRQILTDMGFGWQDREAIAERLTEVLS